MPEPIPDSTAPFVYKALGSLEATAQRTTADIETIKRALDDLPARMEDTFRRLVLPLNDSVKSLESDISEVQTTVNRWKAILGAMMVVSGLAGWLVANFITLKKMVGF
jgi:hypothetical protein